VNSFIVLLPVRGAEPVYIHIFAEIAVAVFRIDTPSGVGRQCSQ
jgi:hypothetical protein